MTEKKEETQKTASEQPEKSSLPILILRLLIAPSRALAEIKATPKYLGPFLILLLFIGANTGFLYVYASKIQVEQTLPGLEELDQWTENATMWASSPGVNIAENSADFINGSYYGNRSIQFSLPDSAVLPVTLVGIGPVDCYGSDGYTELSVRIRFSSPAVIPQNISVYLYSGNASDYYYYNSSEAFANLTTNSWNNLTFPLGTDEWIGGGFDANWSSISGFKLELTWPANSNITVLIDGLFFHGVFRTPIEMLGNAYIMNFAVISMTQFVIQWALLCGLIYVMTKAFGAKTYWKSLLVAIGFILVTMLIQAVANAALFSTLAPVRYPFSFLGGVEGEAETALTQIIDATSWVNMISSYIRMGVYAWIIALAGVAVKQLTGFSLTKGLIISAAAFFASIMLSYMLGI